MSEEIQLPIPQKALEFPLMKAFEMRRTKRKWKHENVSIQNMSNLLWAACGVNAPASKRNKSRRTVPSGCNSQAVGIYVAMSYGLYQYNETKHSLHKILDEDIREKLTNQKMLKSMPLGLIYVSDYSKLSRYTGKDMNDKWFISGTETGYMSQNVYLYCASAQMSTAVIGLVDRIALEKAMGLNESEKVVFTQAVGMNC